MPFLVAQAADPAQPSLFGGPMLPFLLLFVAIFYFFVLRPQNKQRETHKAFLAKLSKGDEVVTAAGLIGKVDRVAGDVVFIEVSNNVKIRVLKDQIANAYRTPEEKPAPAEEPARK